MMDTTQPTLTPPVLDRAREPGTKQRTMKTFVMRSLGDVGFMEKPIPTPGPTDAVVMTTKALICTSDAHTVHGAIGPRANLTLGHEAVGVISAVGTEVKDFMLGDRVVVGAITPDWFDVNSQNGHSSQSNGPLGGWKFANVGAVAEAIEPTMYRGAIPSPPNPLSHSGRGGGGGEEIAAVHGCASVL